MTTRGAARAVLAAALILWTGATLRDAGDAWIDRTVLPQVFWETSVEVRDRHGALLRAYPVSDGLMRMGLSDLADVDPLYRAMLIRYEDKRFYSHPGVDLLAMARATGQAILSGKAVSGGSTLTMQVARLLEDGSTGRWAGKLRQIRVALALERRMPKERILSLYLTHAPFGGNLEGVRAASYAWFGKPPRRLRPEEAALLVALPQSPTQRRPDRHAQAARSARDQVLDRMEAEAVLDPATAQVAQHAPVPHDMRAFPLLAPHLADRLRADDPTARRHDVTIDASLQAGLQGLAARAAKAAGNRISAAIVVADHRTGEILASVGSAGYEAARNGYVDMTRALRSPGSTLKPLVYGLAFDRGLAHPETVIRDAPAQFGTYAPRNFDGEFHGDLPVRKALQLSLNVPVVKLTQALGPARVMSALRRSGAEPVVPGGRPGLAISLGGVGVTLEDLVQLYAALAAGGKGPRLTIMPGEQNTPKRLMGPEAAWQVGHILAGLTPPPGAPRGALAYKTGTSYGYRDTWAVGFDGAHVIGVWLGRPDGTPVPGALGADLAAPLLFEAFGRLKPAFDGLPPPPPTTLIVETADLPPPLQRFRDPGAVFAAPADAPELSFPPDGARLSPSDRLVVKLRGGQGPFSLLADGRPIATGLRGREWALPHPGAGFSTLVIVDANGRSDRVQVELQ
ncbi:penicillin-binding protein 1C [Chachezhania antarctica]|uniref:penicillin-binding protein 1C n=1 Tax=Chachezhania antarctica TaxID=2340860 RepID=UPI000EAE8C60|nr:penicillin-binding protein 1C [Chachezhania antarctica]